MSRSTVGRDDSDAGSYHVRRSFGTELPARTYKGWLRVLMPSTTQLLKLCLIALYLSACKRQRHAVHAAYPLRGARRYIQALAYFLDARDFDKALARLCLATSQQIGHGKSVSTCVRRSRNHLYSLFESCLNNAPQEHSNVSRVGLGSICRR